MLRFWLAFSAGVFILTVSGVVASMASAQSGGDPVAVVAAYEMARNRRDFDAALSYFADDATISQRATTFGGKEEIRRFLDASAARSRFVVVSDRRASGTHVSWTERSGGQASGQLAGPNAPGTGAPGPNGFVVTVEAIVQDGKIRSLAYVAGGQAPVRLDPAVEGRAHLPATLGFAAVLGVLASVVLIASIGLHGTNRGASVLRGRLLQDLQGWSAARH